MKYDVPHDLSPIMTFHRQWNGTDYVVSPFNNPENIYLEILTHSKGMPVGLVFYFVESPTNDNMMLHSTAMEFRHKSNCINGIIRIQNIPGFAGFAHERCTSVSNTTIIINDWFQTWSTKE